MQSSSFPSSSAALVFHSALLLDDVSLDRAGEPVPGLEVLDECGAVSFVEIASEI